MQARGGGEEDCGAMELIGVRPRPEGGSIGKAMGWCMVVKIMVMVALQLW